MSDITNTQATESTQKKTALLFSGQGSQYEGMGKKLYDENPALYDGIFETAGEVLGFDIKKIMFEGSAQELAKTVVSQPAIFTMSLMCAEKYKQSGDYCAVAGHSLGEYAAMVNAGMVDIKTGYTIIKYRSECMQQGAEKNGGTMSAIIGAGNDTIEKICKEVTDGGDYVTPVNYNSRQQTVIAGSPAGVEKASKLLKEAGAKRAVPLAVAAAFHSEYMKEAGLKFRELIENITFSAPQKAFYSNVLAKRLEDISDIKELLSRHIYSPVRFTDELDAMRADGIERFVECGPGKALVGMVKKTLDDAETEITDN